jgi:hypothetical protein
MAAKSKQGKQSSNGGNLGFESEIWAVATTWRLAKMNLYDIHAAVASVVGKNAERAVASLFTPGGTHALVGEFAGINDFEVVAFLVVLPEQEATG